MTSIRGRIKGNFLTDGDIEFFRKCKGFVPLCCICIEYANPVTQERYEEPLYRCDQLEKAIPYAEFEKFCLECQAQIEKEIGKLKDFES